MTTRRRPAADPAQATDRGDVAGRERLTDAAAIHYGELRPIPQAHRIGNQVADGLLCLPFALRAVAYEDISRQGDGLIEIVVHAKGRRPIADPVAASDGVILNRTVLTVPSLATLSTKHCQ